jgi:hypothetical protein
VAGLLNRPPLAAALACLLAVAAAPGALEPSRLHAQRMSLPDSIALGDSARTAQIRFERLRRSLVPTSLSAPAGRCDERIGRFCLSHTGRRDDWWEPRPEPVRVTQAREELLTFLERAAGSLPGDGWIAGQRARYLVEAGRPDVWPDLPCRAEGWWCEALAGFALHAAGDFAASGERFAGALRLMDPSIRRSWENLDVLLEPGERRAYRQLADEQRAAFEERFWRLANPLYLVPGNDRRTEHLSRQVRDRLFATSEHLDGTRWADDLRQILIRYGEAATWERVPPHPYREGSQPLIARYRPSARQFLPGAAAATAPLELRPDDWRLEDERARSAHAPRYARHWRPLDHQLARFPRGEGSELVAVLGVEPDDVLPRGARVRAGLALDDLERGEPELVSRTFTVPARVALRLALPPGGALASVEAHAPEYVWAARERYGVEGAAGAGARISDLLLLEERGEAESLEVAVVYALPRTHLRPGQPFAVFWELSGLPGSEGEIAFTLTLEAEDPGWLRRALVRLGARRDPELPSLRWTQPLEEGEREMARSLRVSPPLLPPGRYRLRLVATLPDGSELVSLRELRLAR